MEAQEPVPADTLDSPSALDVDRALRPESSKSKRPAGTGEDFRGGLCTGCAKANVFCEEQKAPKAVSCLRCAVQRMACNSPDAPAPARGVKRRVSEFDMEFGARH